MTIETARTINSELASQITRKLDEIQVDLNWQIALAVDEPKPRKYFHNSE